MITAETILKTAKATGLTIIGKAVDAVVFPGHKAGGFVIRNDKGGDSLWNPLTDDADNAMIRRGADINVSWLPVSKCVEVFTFFNGKCITRESYYADAKAQAEREAVILCAAAKWDAMQGEVK